RHSAPAGGRPAGAVSDGARSHERGTALREKRKWKHAAGRAGCCRRRVLPDRRRPRRSSPRLPAGLQGEAAGGGRGLPPGGDGALGGRGRRRRHRHRVALRRDGACRMCRPLWRMERTGAGMLLAATPETDFEEIVAGLGLDVAAKVKPYEDPVPAQEREREDDPAPAREGEESEKAPAEQERSTRLNSSHVNISYDVFCLKKITH